MAIHKELLAHQGRKHSVPICLDDFVNDLNNLEQVENVGIGRFFKKGGEPKKQENSIKYYNETNHTLKITSRCKGFTQHFFITVSPDHREEVEKYISSYKT